MKRFFIRLSIFIFILIISDRLLGAVFKLYDYSNGGEINKIYSIMTKESPDLLILGSSRASHHYVPSVIEDSLHLNVFNAGLDGQGTCISYGFLKGIAQRKYPRYIVCEITPEFDLYDGSVSINNFYPYINLEDVYSLIIDFDTNERYKLISNAYRLNSSIFRLIPSIFLNRRPFVKGYSPIYETLSKESEKDAERSELEKEEIYKKEKNRLKEKYLNALITEAKKNDCQIAFYISPVYMGADSTSYREEIELIRKYNLPISNHLNDPRFIYKPELFSDKVHLNHEGAKEYSKIIASELKTLQYGQGPSDY